MSTIDNHVDVQISKETATVSRTGFGTPAILTYHTRFAEVFREYGSVSEMATDGFATTDLAYKMAAAIFAQSPRPSSVIVGRRAVAPLRTVLVQPVQDPPFASTAYSIEIDGETFTYTTDATPTVAEWTAGLTALINLGSVDVLATDQTTNIKIERANSPGGVATAGTPFVLAFDDNRIKISDTTADTSMDAELTTLQGANDDWYGLVADCYDNNNIETLATAIESAGPKIYAAETQDQGLKTSTGVDIASTLQALALDRTFIVATPSIDPSPAAAWLGLQLPTDPGSTTWKFKTLATALPTPYTTGEITFLDNKNANYYSEVNGINITAEGVMASGEFIDVTRFVDWLTARIKENVFLALARNPKIPYTNAGIQAIVAEVEGVLRQGVFNGGINGEEDITVTAPLASEVDANDKASRLLPDIEFIATLAGAIHKTVIRGKVVA